MATRKAAPAAGTARAGRKMAKSALKRQQILDAAAKVFRERGYAYTTLNDIAAEAGTQAGSLYYYFASRDELVEKVLEMSMQNTAHEVIEAVAALPPDARHLQRIETGIRTHIASILTMDDYLIAYQRIIYQVPAEVRERFMFFTRAYATYWRKLIAAAQKSGELRADLDATLLRLILLGAISWALEWYKPGPASPTDVADHVVSIFFRGIVPTGTGTGTPPAAAAPRRAVGARRGPRGG